MKYIYRNLFVYINYLTHYKRHRFYLFFQGFSHCAVVFLHPKLVFSTCPCHSFSSSVSPRSVILRLNPIRPSILPSILPSIQLFFFGSSFHVPFGSILGFSVEICFLDFVTCQTTVTVLLKLTFNVFFSIRL